MDSPYVCIQPIHTLLFEIYLMRNMLLTVERVNENPADIITWIEGLINSILQCQLQGPKVYTIFVFFVMTVSRFYIIKEPGMHKDGKKKTSSWPHLIITIYNLGVHFEPNVISVGLPGIWPVCLLGRLVDLPMSNSVNIYGSGTHPKMSPQGSL